MIDLKQVKKDLIKFKANGEDFEKMDAYLKDISKKISEFLPYKTAEQVENDLYEWWCFQQVKAVFSSDTFMNLGKDGRPAPMTPQPSKV